MASHLATKFEQAISSSLEELGLGVELKAEQRLAIESIVLNSRDVLAILPTGFGKSLIYQILPGVFDFLTRHSGTTAVKNQAMVLVVSPLNALMRDQISKLNEKGFSAYMVQGQFVNVEDSRGEEYRASLPMSSLKNPKCRILFVHPEVCVNDKTFQVLLKSQTYQKRVKTVVVDEAHLIREWDHFRPAYGKLDILSSFFPNTPHIALTATATKATQSLIIDSLRLNDPIIIMANPDRKNIFYECKVRPSSGEDKLNTVLAPLANELREKKINMPLTIVYGTLATCSDAFLFFCQSLGKDQYYPAGADHISKNRLFAQFHAEYPQHEKDRILDEIVRGECKAKVLFVTVAFGIGVDVHNIRRVIHIGVPKTMEEYFQETGRAGRDGENAVATLYYNGRDIGRGKNPVSDVMRQLATSQTCKREIILHYFGHEMPNRSDLHSCCDYHKAICDCQTCIDTLLEEMEGCSLENVPTETLVVAGCSSAEMCVTPEQKKAIRAELEAYRASLQCGKSCVGGITLTTGFSLELIDLTVKHCHKLDSVVAVQDLLPVFSRENADIIYNIVSRHIH